jgi:hypothetical protein
MSCGTLLLLVVVVPARAGPPTAAAVVAAAMAARSRACCSSCLSGVIARLTGLPSGACRASQRDGIAEALLVYVNRDGLQSTSHERSASGGRVHMTA